MCARIAILFAQRALSLTKLNCGLIILEGGKSVFTVTIISTPCVASISTESSWTSQQTSILEHGQKVISPALADRGGWAVFIGTPRGKNAFYRIWENAKANPDKWYAEMLKASQTKLLSDAELREQRDLKSENQYEQEFECSFEAALTGAYYGELLRDAEKQGRLCRVSADPLLPLRLYFDIGGAGATADANAIWVVQFVGQEIRVLDYIEGRGQPLGYYTELLRDKGYKKTECVLPHDGGHHNNVTGKRYEDHLRDAGWNVTVIPNQGRGAASARIEALRRLFPKLWFNRDSTGPGRDAIGYYHEKMDPKRNVGLGPEHSVDRIRGWADVPLNAEGKKEATKLGQILKDKGLQSIVSSDLSRAADTAAEIGRICNVRPSYTSALRPWNLGDLQGKPTDKCLAAIRAYV
jgi:hypothetical protein